MEPTPFEAVLGGILGAGGGIAPPVLGLAAEFPSLCLFAAAVAA